MIKDKIFYNQASAQKLGWNPSWFNADDFDDDLIQKIEEFQKQNKLDIDGCCGQQTFKKIYTEQEAKKELLKHQMENKVKNIPFQDTHLIVVGDGCKQQTLSIKWSKFVGLNDSGNLALPSNTYKTLGYERKPKMFVLHHDAALSSKSCHDILLRRGLSVQFSIDNDGTIYQMTPMNVSAQHAGSLNKLSVGVEITNAVEIKYQGHYKIKGFGERPIIKKFKCHGKNYGDVLGFYPVQIEALKVLIRTVCNYYEIPFEFPMDAEGNVVMDTVKECQEGKYQGVCCHYHLDKNKWDPVEIDLKKLMQEICSDEGCHLGVNNPTL